MPAMAWMSMPSPSSSVMSPMPSRSSPATEAPRTVGAWVSDGKHVVVHMHTLPFTNGAQVIVLTNQAFVSDASDRTTAAITDDPPVTFLSTLGAGLGSSRFFLRSSCFLVRLAAISCGSYVTNIQ